MDIAALSSGLSQLKLQQNVSLALTKKAMDLSETENNELLKMLNSSVPNHPTLGRTIDVSA